MEALPLLVSSVPLSIVGETSGWVGELPQISAADDDVAVEGAGPDLHRLLVVPGAAGRLESIADTTGERLHVEPGCGALAYADLDLPGRGLQHGRSLRD